MEDGGKKYFRSWSHGVEWYISRFTAEDFGKKEDGLLYLRNRLFITILLIVFPICAVVYLPSVFISFKTGKYVIGVSDTFAMGILCCIFFARSISVQTKKMLMSVTFYFLAVVILLYLGVKGPGMFILLCVSVLISLYQTKRAGLIAVGINAVIFLFYLAAGPDEKFNFHFFEGYEAFGWFGVNVNLIAFNLIVVFAATTLVDQITDSWLKEMQLQSVLTKEREELIVAKHRAEESDRLKSAFLANMSHEIRTPMNGLLGFAELLNDPAITPEEQQQYLAIIRKSGNRMLTIINNIIDISQIEAGSVEVILKTTNINDQLDYVFRILKPDADLKQLEMKLAAGLPNDQATIITDELKFITILMNLVRNAIKYTKTGFVELGYELTTADSAGQPLHNPELLFFVKDTGMGIPENCQTVIFESFRQADIEDKQAFQGAGLGLSIAGAYINMLGGKIWVVSEPWKGSTFYFTIPYQRPGQDNL